MGIFGLYVLMHIGEIRVFVLLIGVLIFGTALGYFAPMHILKAKKLIAVAIAVFFIAAMVPSTQKYAHLYKIYQTKQMQKRNIEKGGNF